jgi:Na+-transporting NADH:ubiquinone oxidoreductase subunit NqrE
MKMNGWLRLFLFICAIWAAILWMANIYDPARAFLFPMGALFALGSGVAWVRRGFRS